MLLSLQSSWHERGSSCNIKRNLDKFPLKQIIFNWNALSVDLKSTAEFTEFEYLLKQQFLAKYSLETDCLYNCFSCSAK